MHTNESRTIEINVTLSRGVVVMLTLLLIAALFAVWFSSGEKQVVADEPEQISAVQTARLRRFYRTGDVYDGDEAATACASGFHFASLWELLDPSNLDYSAEHPDARFPNADQGGGPFTGSGGFPIHGWIRTGYSADSTGFPGTSNCYGYTSDTDTHFGTTTGLIFDWSSAVPNVFVWDTDVAFCDYRTGVWCVED